MRLEGALPGWHLDPDSWWTIRDGLVQVTVRAINYGPSIPVRPSGGILAPPLVILPEEIRPKEGPIYFVVTLEHGHGTAMIDVDGILRLTDGFPGDAIPSAGMVKGSTLYLLGASSS